MKKMATVVLSLIGMTPILSLAAEATTEPSTHPFYVELGAGASFTHNSNWYRDPLPPAQSPLLQPSKTRWVALYEATVGYQIPEYPVRVALSYDHFGTVSYNWAQTLQTVTNQTSKGKIDTQALFANVYYDFNNDTGFIPYVGVGVGQARHHTKYDYYAIAPSTFHSHGPVSETQTNFAYKLTAGVNYAFDENWRAGLGVSYMDLGSERFNSSSFSNQAYVASKFSKSDHYRPVSVMATVSYAFG